MYQSGAHRGSAQARNPQLNRQNRQLCGLTLSHLVRRASPMIRFVQNSSPHPLGGETAHYGRAHHQHARRLRSSSGTMRGMSHYRPTHHGRAYRQHAQVAGPRCFSTCLDVAPTIDALPNRDALRLEGLQPRFEPCLRMPPLWPHALLGPIPFAELGFAKNCLPEGRFFAASARSYGEGALI